jgi:hypothetical protein
MAATNVIEFVANERQVDFPALAKASISDTMSDVEFDAALDTIVREPAVTLAGVQAKFESLKGYIASLADGGEVLPYGWEDIVQLTDGIEAALARLSTAH